MNGTAVFGEPVVIVEVHDGNVNLRTGHIASTDSSHVLADNRSRTVVWGDREFQPDTGSPDEAHEKEFKVDDIHLLKRQEAEGLQDPATVQSWFGSIYEDWVVAKIHRALKRARLR